MPQGNAGDRNIPGYVFNRGIKDKPGILSSHIKSVNTWAAPNLRGAARLFCLIHPKYLRSCQIGETEEGVLEYPKSTVEIYTHDTSIEGKAVIYSTLTGNVNTSDLCAVCIKLRQVFARSGTESVSHRIQE